MSKSVVAGLMGRCPECREGQLFGRFMEVRPCDRCGLDLRASNLGDGLSTVLFLLIGGLGCFGIIWGEVAWNAPIWLLIAVWLPLIGILCVVTQQPFKGLMIALLHRNQAGEARTKPLAVTLE